MKFHDAAFLVKRQGSITSFNKIPISLVSFLKYFYSLKFANQLFLLLVRTTTEIFIHPIFIFNLN